MQALKISSAWCAEAVCAPLAILLEVWLRVVGKSPGIHPETLSTCFLSITVQVCKYVFPQVFISSLCVCVLDNQAKVR